MPSFTLGQIETRILDGLDNNTLEFTENQLRLVINEFLCRLNLLVGINIQTLPIALGGFTVAGKLRYDTPAGIEVPVRVDYEFEELSRFSLRRLARSYPTWAVDSSAVDGTTARWADIGLGQFVIHPRDAFGGALLQVTGICPMVPLVNQDDPVPLEDQWADLLVSYGRMRSLLKEGGKAFADAVGVYKGELYKNRACVMWRDFRWPAFFIEKTVARSDGRATAWP